MHNAAYLRHAQVRYARAQQLYESAERELGNALAGANFTGWLADIEANWKRLHLDALLTSVVEAEEDMVEAFRRVVCDDPAVHPNVKHVVRVLLCSKHPDASVRLLELALHWGGSTAPVSYNTRLITRRVATRGTDRSTRGSVSFRR